MSFKDEGWDLPITFLYYPDDSTCFPHFAQGENSGDLFRALNSALITSGKYCHSTSIVGQRHQDLFRTNCGAPVFAS